MHQIGVLWNSPRYVSPDDIEADFSYVLQPDKHVQIQRSSSLKFVTVKECLYVASGLVAAVPKDVVAPAVGVGAAEMSSDQLF